MRWIRDPEGDPLAPLLWGLAAAVLLHDIYYLLVNLSSPLLGAHAFRQTQTALSVYWIRYDGPRLAYETPVMGAPWSIPFEFPFYEWLVAILFWLGLSIESAGRLVSFAFLLGCVWPFAILCRVLRLPKCALPLMTILFLAAPVYAFWGRAVLIETCALFLALLWLALLLRILSHRRASPIAVACALAVGCLAILQKATTFPSFALIGGGALLVAFLKTRRSRDLRQAAYLVALGVATCVVPVVVGFAWIVFTDHVKGKNPAGRWLDSQNLAAFNYGTWAQRHSPELWAALQRTAAETLGLFFVAAVVVILAGAIRLKTVRLAIIVSLAAFLLPFAIFTNLHIVHNYYQTANAVFLVAALAFALTGLYARGWSTLALLALIAVVAGQIGFFARSFQPQAMADFHRSPGYRISLLTKEKVPPDEAILVDIGEWSSVVDFYSQRKGLSVMPALPAELVERIFADPSQFLGGMRAGGIVSCPLYGPPSNPQQLETAKLIASHVAGRRVLATAGACRLLAFDREPAR